MSANMKFLMDKGIVERTTRDGSSLFSLSNMPMDKAYIIYARKCGY